MVWTLPRCAIIREPECMAEAVRKAHSPLFRLSLSPLVASPFDDRFPQIARRRTSIRCPRDRALSKSRTAILLGGSVAQPKLTKGRKDHARSPQRAAFGPT